MIQRYKNVEFITSVASTGSYLKTDMSEIAIAGKSNVGKSSFINMIADNKKLAKTSNTPGRTRLINYFKFDDKFMLVDLPGYGFAKVSKEEKNKWGELIETYLLNSKKLKHIILLLDSRHLPTNEDMQMVNFMYHYALPFTIILTKIDKLSRNQLAQSKKDIIAKLRTTENNIFCVSSETKYGRDEVMAFLNDVASREVEPCEEESDSDQNV